MSLASASWIANARITGTCPAPATKKCRGLIVETAVGPFVVCPRDLASERGTTCPLDDGKAAARACDRIFGG